MAKDADVEARVEHRHQHAQPEHGTSGAAAEPAASRVSRLAAGLGNRNFARLLARMPEGGGLLADGTVHPDVQAAIGAMAGRGSRLDQRSLSAFAPSHGDLSDARIHVGPTADTLARAVNAVAFTVGSDVFFRDGAYDPGSGPGQRLLAHELAHVVQQRGAPAAGALKVSSPGDVLERDADSVARDASS